MDKSNIINKGLIVSIQGYSQETTQELAMKAIEGGAVGIRTDQPVVNEVPVIGLKKLSDKKYYITTSREAIIEVSKWTNLIAIDSRKGNPDIDLLYAHCHVNNLKIVADIETLEDVISLLDLCNKKKLIKPSYIATTFSYNGHLVKEIKEITDIPIIAEGGYNKQISIGNVRLNGANNVCIGTAISDIKKLTEKYNDYWSMKCC